MAGKIFINCERADQAKATPVKGVPKTEGAAASLGMTAIAAVVARCWNPTDV